MKAVSDELLSLIRELMHDPLLKEWHADHADYADYYLPQMNTD